MSSCVILGKIFVIINDILRNERLYLINFIYSFGAGITQLMYPFMTYLIMECVCYNCSILIIGSLIFHIIPITILISSQKGSSEAATNSKPIVNTLRKIEESRYGDISSASYDFYPEMIKYPSDVLDMDGLQWKNPSNFMKNGSNKEGCSNDDHFLEILDSQRIINSEGVEILETITEEEETKFPEEQEVRKVTDEAEHFNTTDKEIDLIYEEVNKKFKDNPRRKRNGVYGMFTRFIIQKYENGFTVVYRQIINPLNRSLKNFQFYPAVILKSIDIFSYLLFVTFILPNQAMNQYLFVERENCIYLITLMGLCWIIYSIIVLRFHRVLKQNCIHYFHFFGLLAKFFGYLCKYCTTFFFH